MIPRVRKTSAGYQSHIACSQHADSHGGFPFKPTSKDF